MLFAITSCVVMRGNYLEYKELGEQYVQELLTNYKVKYSVMAIKENCIFSIWFLAISSSLTSVVFIFFNICDK